MKYFHVDRQKAERRYAEILAAVSSWRSLAQKLDISRNEITRMETCFCKAAYL